MWTILSILLTCDSNSCTFYDPFSEIDGVELVEPDVRIPSPVCISNLGRFTWNGYLVYSVDISVIIIFKFSSLIPFYTTTERWDLSLSLPRAAGITIVLTGKISPDYIIMTKLWIIPTNTAQDGRSKSLWESIVTLHLMRTQIWYRSRTNGTTGVLK